MTTQGPTTITVKRSGRTVVVEHKNKPKKPDKAAGWHIRMAISRAMHVSMTQSEARHLADVLLTYAETLPKNSN